jgi:hypothetical protein
VERDMREVRVRFQDRILKDHLHENPIDQFQARARRRNLIILAVVIAVAVWRWLA